ncbi:hypothetical protein ACFLT7_08820, partial [candidate division KSB1 bacterium]
GNHLISFTCEIPVAGKYRVSLDVVKGPESGIVQMFMDEAAAGPEVDLYAEKSEVSPGEYVGTLELEEGSNDLMFKIIGVNDKSSGQGLDLTNIICERVD